ncbi:MAG TPA: YihY/virulence factor BrkB family protein [Candidatus Baltobacteraceae bacterium]|nr:YihY/virulence factor BrkB family protein [Candidatus Baltobacteraceae bacterium]
MKTAWQVLRDAFGGWQRHQDGRLAAALAYYAVFSLAPLLLVVIALLGLFLGQSDAQQQVQGQLQQIIGRSGSRMLNVLIAGANHHGTGTIALIVGAGLILFSAIGMFMALQNALDEVFEIRPESKGGFIELVVLRLHALIVIAALAIVAIAALALANVIGGVMQSAFGSVFGGGMAGPAYEAATGIINLAAMTVFLAVAYRKLPQCPVDWKSAYAGAAVTAFILLIGEAALSMYFTRFHPAAPYGAAGGIIILLLWIYYSAQLMLFGAEITRANQARRAPARAVPAQTRTGEVSEDLRRQFPASR